MRDVAATNFALEQGKTFYGSKNLSIDEEDGSEICAGPNRTGNRQVKVVA
jgi:hypothetical protein